MPLSAEEKAKRLAFVKEHLRCPHCDQDLERWEMTVNPFSDWSTDHLYVCMRQECPYLQKSIEMVAAQGASGGAYCFVYDPSRNWCGPMAARIPTKPQG